MMYDSIKPFQKVLYLILLVLLAVVLIVSIINLGITVFSLLIDEDGYLLESHEVIQIFGYFLLVLIGVEFFESILTYFRDNSIHVEIIIMVAMTAVARKIILLDSGEPDLHLFGLGVLVLSLGVVYYLIRRSNREKEKERYLQSIHRIP